MTIQNYLDIGFCTSSKKAWLAKLLLTNLLPRSTE